MDLQTLSQLFATTYNPDPNVRKAAELQIRKVGVIFCDVLRWRDKRLSLTRISIHLCPG